MDYSKIKKIFYILCIISLLLSLKSKVFGAWSLSGNYQSGISFSLDNLPDLPQDCDSFFLLDSYYNNTKYWLFAWDSSTTYCAQRTKNGAVSFYAKGTSNYSSGYLAKSNSNGTSWDSFSSVALLNAMPYTTNCYTNDKVYKQENVSSLKDSPSNILFKGTKLPEISNSLQDLESLNFDVISVNGWDYSTKSFDILFYDRNVTDTNSTEGLYPKRVITLNQNTSYFQSDLSADPSINSIFWIPIGEIGLNLYVGGSYEIRLAERVEINPPQYGVDYSYNYLGNPVTFTISSDVSLDKINALNKEIEDTTNKKYHEETINSINNINNNINNLNNALTNTTPDNSISSDIDNSLDFNNQNEGLSNLNSGFFSRLTTMLSNLLGYNLGEDTSVSLPVPNSDKNIILHSITIYNNVTGALRLIINAFWVYIFTFYMWKFINKIYIAVSTGNILDTFSSSGEAITNDML